MKKIISISAAIIPVFFLTSCATPPPVAFHNTDSTALVIKSVDDQTSQMLQPRTSSLEKNGQVADMAKTLPQHETAVVMLENYTERRLGEQFRDRSLPLFLCLRNLGYQHIIFVQGQNVSDPDGLNTLVEYH